MVASYQFVVRRAYEMDTDKRITKNDNTYAKKEADIYMQKKKVCIKTYFSHSYIYRDIYIKSQSKFNPYKGLMAWRIKLNTGTMSYIVIKML